ncbi:MAG TPA: serine hydrolase domain-containing protein [Xanthomonadales bacterium]|nr:serine hydrolase domain-containing protein [Xanthomonadales bacterium]
MTAVTQETRLPDVRRVIEWADRSFTEALENNQVSGAVISVVQDGEIVLETGYGAADVVTGQPASAYTTRVRIGSTTKTFTANLVAQLLLQGQIGSLDDPANRYLKRFQLPDNGGVAISLRHLLTHTAGFEDRFFFIGADEPVRLPASADVIESLRPEFVRPVGEKVVYSNFGVAVLGYVIEDILGQPITVVMKEQIFQPLGMMESELLDGIAEPEGLARPGMLDEDGVVGPTPFTAINPAVAQTGSIVSTAHDMALYMNSQLGFGDWPGVEAITALRTPLAANFPGITGLGMVYFLDEWAGQPVISHGGNWAGFHTWMWLLPEQNTGVFISLLSEAPPGSQGERLLGAINPDWAGPASPAALSAYGFLNQFMTEFFGAKRELPAENHLTLNQLEMFSGYYRADRRAVATHEALSGLAYFGADVLEISAQSDGLYLNGAGPWIPAGKNTFMLDVPARPLMAFKPDGQTGQPVMVPDIGIYTFTRIPPWAHPKLHAIALHLLLPITLLGLLYLFKTGQTPPLRATALVGLSGLAMLGFALLGLGAGQDTLMSPYFSGHAARVLGFSIAANVQLLASLAALAYAWKCRNVVAVRRPSLLFGLLGLVIGLILLQYNIIGFHRL